MGSEDRKAAVRAYKTRTPPQGAFAVRCTPENRAWVGASRNLEAARNSTWFLLRHGQHRARDLQAAWDAHGEAAFVYDVLETLDPDVSPFAISDLLEEKKRHWAGALGAPLLLP